MEASAWSKEFTGFLPHLARLKNNQVMPDESIEVSYTEEFGGLVEALEKVEKLRWTFGTVRLIYFRRSF